MFTEEEIGREERTSLDGSTGLVCGPKIDGYLSTGCIEVTVAEGMGDIRISYIPDPNADGGEAARKLTVSQLKETLKANNIEFTSRDTKETLISLLGGAA